MDQGQNKKNPKKIIGIIVGIAIIISAQFVIFKKPDLNKQMQQAAADLNKTGPTMIDEQTRFDSASVLTGNIFQYNYTMVNLVAEDIDIAIAQKEVEPQLINSVKTNADLKVYRDNQTTLNYNYYDKAGKFLFLVSVTPDKYK